VSVTQPLRNTVVAVLKVLKTVAIWY